MDLGVSESFKMSKRQHICILSEVQGRTYSDNVSLSSPRLAFRKTDSDEMSIPGMEKVKATAERWPSTSNTAATLDNI